MFADTLDGLMIKFQEKHKAIGLEFMDLGRGLGSVSIYDMSDAVVGVHRTDTPWPPNLQPNTWALSLA